MVPLFPELRRYLVEASEQSSNTHEPDGLVVPRFSDGDKILRTGFGRIVARARLKPWAKTLQNLRVSRQTVLEEQFRRRVVCSWLGNFRGLPTAINFRGLKSTLKKRCKIRCSRAVPASEEVSKTRDSSITPRYSRSNDSRGGTRTRTSQSGPGILSPVRLPIPPLGQVSDPLCYRW